MIYEYPLTWPMGLTRTVSPTRSRFDTPEERVKRDLQQQFVLMRATDVVVTSNSELRRDGRPYANQRIEDMGVSVYFKRKGKDQVIACDRWNSIRDNLQAIAKTIEALRAIDRWGTGEMVDAAYAGFTAIPANASAGSRRRPWHEVLGVSPDAPRELVEAAGKVMQRKDPPRHGRNRHGVSGGAERHRGGAAMSHIPAILHLLVLIGFAFLVLAGLVIGAGFVLLLAVRKAMNR